VQEIVHNRKQSNTTQHDCAEWVGVERRKIIDFETGNKINIELLFILADKFDVQINFNKFL
jgi:DNA-binding XRE family transcriptional regulator